MPKCSWIAPSDFSRVSVKLRLWPLIPRWSQDEMAGLLRLCVGSVSVSLAPVWTERSPSTTWRNWGLGILWRLMEDQSGPSVATAKKRCYPWVMSLLSLKSLFYTYYISARAHLWICSPQNEFDSTVVVGFRLVVRMEPWSCLKYLMRRFNFRETWVDRKVRCYIDDWAFFLSYLLASAFFCETAVLNQ